MLKSWIPSRSQSDPGISISISKTKTSQMLSSLPIPTENVVGESESWSELLSRSAVFLLSCYRFAISSSSVSGSDKHVTQRTDKHTTPVAHTCCWAGRHRNSAINPQKGFVLHNRHREPAEFSRRHCLYGCWRLQCRRSYGSGAARTTVSTLKTVKCLSASFGHKTLKSSSVVLNS